MLEMEAFTMQAFLSTFSHTDLVNILYSTFTTFGVGIAGILVFLMYAAMEDQKSEAAEKEENTFVYGTKETYVTIQHQVLNKDDGEFLRHVRALSACSSQDFMDILGNFTAFLKIHDHPNYADVSDVRRILRFEELESAILWLSTAQAFWMLHPWMKAVPYIPYDFHTDSDAEDTAAPAPPSSPIPA